MPGVILKSPAVTMPAWPSACYVTFPTPQITRTGSGRKNETFSCSEITVRFLMVAGNFGQQFVGGNADSGG